MAQFLDTSISAKNTTHTFRNPTVINTWKCVIQNLKSRVFLVLNLVNSKPICMISNTSVGNTVSSLIWRKEEKGSKVMETWCSKWQGRAGLLEVAGPSDQQTSRRGWAGHSSGQEGQGASQEQPGASLAPACSWYSSASVGLLGRGKEVEISGEVARKNKVQ